MRGRLVVRVYGRKKIWRGNKAWIVYGTGTIKIVIGNKLNKAG